MPPARQLLIIWHSRTGAAQQLANAALNGARQAIVQLEAQAYLRVSMLACTHVQAEDLLQSDAYLFCAPENLGSLTGAMKECLDLHYYALLEQVNGRPYGAIISAGSDGTGALRQLQRICTGWRLQLAYPGLIMTLDAQTPEAIWAAKTISPQQSQQAYELGANLCALLH
ncbi:flavodoxin family protein [Alcaligenes endophyticus]|uniref:NAD(P)H-dependent oxidoreductase n=1 Tax=Alcaligenes endophyticus TaxID=1929088 RepID=A0ABT8EHN1_9BURK|nr:NAD(P)H-dependent oxidoreductase [Alcaligenes endophyticus]MCX5592154.1 flavodoxin family protein [Alcaligenes endophyticus]MDN4120801.1 NAD(P)H-dependent oxidoreductase [Alcaligenes endophyticus]